MKNDIPLVSIITPCFNVQRHLPHYFASILAQTWPNLELYLVNDGSTDNTIEVVEEYRPLLLQKGIDFHYINNTKNKGPAAAINHALDKIRGAYLVWPDSDDMLHPESIAARVHFLEKNPQYGFVRTNWYSIDFETRETLEIPEPRENDASPAPFWDLVNSTTFIYCGCYMVRIKLFFSIYPNRRIYETREGQNWQMLLPMAYFHQCGYIEDKLCIIGIRKDSHSRQKRNHREEHTRLLAFENLLADIVHLCGITDKESLRKIEYRHARIMQQFAVRHINTKLLWKQTTRLIINRAPCFASIKPILKYHLPFLVHLKKFYRIIFQAKRETVKETKR